MSDIVDIIYRPVEGALAKPNKTEVESLRAELKAARERIKLLEVALTRALRAGVKR